MQPPDLDAMMMGDEPYTEQMYPPHSNQGQHDPRQSQGTAIYALKY